MSTTHEVTDASFEQDVLKNDVPVLIDYWAPWCQPCKKLSPILDDIATELGDKVKIVKMNIDDNSQTAMAQGITSVPTLHLFSGGELIANVRPGSKQVISDELSKHLS